MYRSLAKPLLFRLDPEEAHHLTMRGAALAGQIPSLDGVLAGQLARPHPALTQTLWGLRFPGPLGLAAGLDKNGEATRIFSALGLGFLEVGTVTPEGQPGNPRPRLFRLPEDGALVNRMGFNNLGAGHLAAQMAAKQGGPRRVPIFANIGKNKETPNEQAAADYRACVRALAGVADGFVVNVSSPNTPGLRSLQSADELGALVGEVLEEVRRQLHAGGRSLPVLVKLSPDMAGDDFAASVEAVFRLGVAGLVVSNTTLSRDGLTHAHRTEAGGLSGRPLTARSTALVAEAYRLTGGRLPLVGVGGVFTAQDAYDKIRAGASLVEAYTALVYEGPGLPRRVNAGLLRLLLRDGFTHVSEAVGSGAR